MATVPAAVVPVPEGGCFTASVTEGAGRLDVRRVSSTGAEVWARELPTEVQNAVALLYSEERVYAALYTNGATGSRVVALDAGTGALLWEHCPEGVGAVGHSKYSSAVELSAKPGVVVVSGRESAGEFREELDAATGRLVSPGARA